MLKADNRTRTITHGIHVVLGAVTMHLRNMHYLVETVVKLNLTGKRARKGGEEIKRLKGSFSSVVK